MPPRRRGIYRDGFFKVSRRLVDSSLWCEPSDVLKVFFFLLERAQDPGGPRDGTVFIARKQLAAKCLMSPEALDSCLSILSAPDPQSRTTIEDGRRIEVLPNGYRVVNYGLYHDKASDEMLSRARAAAGRRGGEESGKSRNNEQFIPKQNRSKPEANRSYGDGDGDGNKTDTLTAPPNPQRGSRRARNEPFEPHPALSRFVGAFNDCFGRCNTGDASLNRAFLKREAEGHDADTLVALPILLAAQVAQGLDELKCGRDKLKAKWLLRDGSGRYAGEDGGTRNTKDWIGSILGIADQTSIGPELLPLVEKYGLLDVMHRLRVKRRKVAC